MFIFFVRLIVDRIVKTDWNILVLVFCYVTWDFSALRILCDELGYVFDILVKRIKSWLIGDL